jgi:hypothetical protein
MPGVAVAAPAGAAKPRCTIVGTSHADHLVGTSHRDVICGLGGNDVIEGRGGDDVLVGGLGDDRLIGGAGKDLLRGGAGTDFLSGGPGVDRCEDSPGTVAHGCEKGRRSANGASSGKSRRHAHVSGEPTQHRFEPPKGPPPCCSVGPDTAAPESVWLWFGRRYVDTAAGEGSITLAVEAWDASGLGSVVAQIVGPGGPVWRTASLVDVSERRAEATLPVPASTPSGDYVITSLSVADKLGNGRTLTGAELGADGLPEFEVFHGPDTEGPKLTGFSLSPTQLDTSGGPGTVAISIGAEDALSGVQSAYAAVQLPGWAPGPLELTGACSNEERPDAGTRHQGTWDKTIPLVQRAIPGTYVVSGVYLCDLAGNDTHYTKAELEELGYPTEFVETGAGDSTPPEVVGFSFAPSVLHAAEGENLIDFYVHVRDDDTGFGEPGLTDAAEIEVLFEHPGPLKSFSDWNGPPELVSGTSRDGVYRQEVRLDADTPVGAYRVEEIIARDRAGNIAYLKAPEMALAGWPLTFEDLP